MQTKNESLLSQLDSYLPGIKEGFDKTGPSLISIKPFESWWEAFFVTTTYTIASAVLAYVLKFLLALIAAIALLVAVATLASSLFLRCFAKTQEGRNQADFLFNIGMKSTAVFLMISFIPAFLTVGMLGLAGYRSLKLISDALPKDASQKIQESCYGAYSSAKEGLNKFSVWVSEQMKPCSSSTEQLSNRL